MEATFGKNGPKEPEEPIEEAPQEDTDENANLNRRVPPPQDPPEMINSLALSFLQIKQRAQKLAQQRKKALDPNRFNHIKSRIGKNIKITKKTAVKRSIEIQKERFEQSVGAS